MKRKVKLNNSNGMQHETFNIDPTSFYVDQKQDIKDFSSCINDLSEIFDKHYKDLPLNPIQEKMDQIMDKVIKDEENLIIEYFNKRKIIMDNLNLSVKEKGYLIHKLHKKYFPSVDHKQDIIYLEEFKELRAMMPKI